jgi:hypothetical protein
VNGPSEDDLAPTRGWLYGIIFALGLYLVATIVAAIAWWLLGRLGPNNLSEPPTEHTQKRKDPSP